jgi:hypothetical protein
MKVIKGFRVIELPLDKKATTVHRLYVREHNDRDNAGKVLFVGNVDYLPMMAHEDIDKYLRALFGRFGEIVQISVSEFSTTSNDKDNTRFAHITFTKKASIKLILNANDNDYTLACKEAAESCNANRPPPRVTKESLLNMFSLYDADEDELEEEVNQYMKDFDEKELFELEQRKRAMNEPDADGFVTVVSR